MQKADILAHAYVRSCGLQPRCWDHRLCSTRTLAIRPSFRLHCRRNPEIQAAPYPSDLCGQPALALPGSPKAKRKPRWLFPDWRRGF
jgi:hypothetical protein